MNCAIKFKTLLKFDAKLWWLKPSGMTACAYFNTLNQIATLFAK